MQIYLCGPIMDRTDEECVAWRQRAADMLVPHTCLDPMRRDYRDEDPGIINEIVHLDKMDIDMSDIVLAYFDQPSVGSSMEIHYAWDRNKIIVVVDVSGRRYLSPWLIYHSTVIVPSLERAVRWINTAFPIQDVLRGRFGSAYVRDA